MIIGILGKAGSGKNQATDFLTTRKDCTNIALADPIKEFISIFGWPRERLYGPSKSRSIPDYRSVIALCDCGWFGSNPSSLICPRCGSKITDTKTLTARIALQKIGDSMRSLYKNVFVEHSINTANKIIANNETISTVIITDCRFQNEVEEIKKSGGVLLKIVRPGISSDIGGIKNHPSEEEQNEIPDNMFDFIIYNNGTLEEFENKITYFYNYFKKKLDI